MDGSASVGRRTVRAGGASGAGRRSRTGLRALWLVLIVIVVVSFAVLLYFGREIYQVAPPIPDSIVVADGNELFSGDDIRQGQDVWRFRWRSGVGVSLGPRGLHRARLDG